MKYEPYKMDALKALMQRAYSLGWFAGRKNLVTISIESEFEGFSGRASESWEHRFVVHTEEVRGDGDKVIWPALMEYGETLEEACHKVLTKLSS